MTNSIHTQSRRAFTLMELMVAVTLSTIIVGTAYAALHATSQVVSITRRQALVNAMLRSAVLRSYTIADDLDPAVTLPHAAEIGLPLPVAEWDQVPDGWPLLRLRSEVVNEYRAPMLFMNHISWTNNRLSTLAAPYGWTAIDSQHAPGDRDQTGDAVQPAYAKHTFHLSLSDPISGEVLELPYAVPGVVGGP
jgi:prepilin-type N-terminal cleavage/methylation domain-containing protein